MATAGGRSVTFFFDLGVASYRETVAERPLTEAIDDYVAAFRRGDPCLKTFNNRRGGPVAQ